MQTTALVIHRFAIRCSQVLLTDGFAVVRVVAYLPVDPHQDLHTPLASVLEAFRTRLGALSGEGSFHMSLSRPDPLRIQHAALDPHRRDRRVVVGDPGTPIAQRAWADPARRP